MPKLTKRLVDDLQFPHGTVTTNGNPVTQAFLWDTETRGFGVRITKEGKRTYIVQSRVHGKEVRSTIGPHGVFTVDQARDAAREVLRAMRQGVDPRQARKAEAAAKITLREIADGYKQDRPLKDSSKKEIERHVTTTFKAWLNQPISAITREAVSKRFNEMKTKGLHGNAPAPSQANQGFAILRALINYANREHRKLDGSPLFAENPVDVLYKKWVPMKARTTRIPTSKVGQVWNMLWAQRGASQARDVLASVDLVLFLMLTGARISEATGLTWDRVNLDECWWHLPDPKNSNPVWLPLSEEAVELLKTRERVEGSPFVFSSWGKTGHLIDPRETMRKVSAASGEDLSPHDLRRTFTTIGVASCSIDLHKVELLTNHVPKGVTARHYLETSRLEYLLPEVQGIADWIVGQGKVAAAMASGANVVPLRAA